MNQSIQKKVFVLHSSHLDLHWIGAQADCLRKGGAIIDDALKRAERDERFHFLIESVRFLEYYSDHYLNRMETLRKAFARGQFEVAASYTDRLENHVDGESLVRNALYGKKIIRELLGMDCMIACHPDLPGFAEQTPQIYKKCGVKYYISARGFKNGARFNWRGLDGSHIVMYNLPGHYAYFDAAKVISAFDLTQKAIHSDDILLGCSSGDMGPAGIFTGIFDGAAKQVDIGEYLHDLNARYPDYTFIQSCAFPVLEQMDAGGLESYQGEYPSRWGHHGSAMNVKFYHLDKTVSQKLLDAEKLTTICKLMGAGPDIGAGPEMDLHKHPLRDSSGNNGDRRYYDLQKTPGDISDWIAYGWRLQVITQDHNFGGVEGAQTEFDRIIYKNAARNIADRLIEYSLEAIMHKESVAINAIAVINTMNWRRNELAYLSKAALPGGCGYVATDEAGRSSKLYETSGAWVFLAEDIPSFGIKTYLIQEQRHPSLCAGLPEPSPSCNAEIFETDGSLVAANSFYALEIDKGTGCLARVDDRETGYTWMKGALGIKAYEDASLGGSERVVDKRLLDDSSAHASKIQIKTSNPLFLEIEIQKEVLDVKIYQFITIMNFKKEIKITVKMNWPGIPDVQLKMGIMGREPGGSIYYGVPYGVQKYGDYLETESLKFGGDEISEELFQRYREAQGFFAVEENGMYAVVASNQSSYDFRSDGVSVLLARDVRNGAEQDYRFTNAGAQEYEFAIATGRGEHQQMSKLAWELQYPVYVRKGESEAGGSIFSSSWLDTGDVGVLTVFAPSMTAEGKYVARLYNTDNKAYPLDIRSAFPLGASACVNMDETAAEEPLNVLGKYEIKTIMLTN